MKTQTTLLSVSFLALMAFVAPAKADTNVLCSVRASAHGADYKPGVDVNGHAVASADVSGSTKPAMGHAVTIPLSVDLAQRMNDVLPAGSKLEAQQGLIEVQPDGRVMINGKDMTAPADTMCSTISKQKEAALKTEDAPKNAPKKAVHHAKKKTGLKPTETAVTEPIAPEAPKAETAPTTPPNSVASPPQTTVPQVLDAAPPSMPMAPGAPSVPQPAPMAPPSAPSPTATPGSSGTPTPPPSGAAVQPSDGGTLAPRGSLDPLSAPQPTPTPSSPSSPSSGGTLSGGAQ